MSFNFFFIYWNRNSLFSRVVPQNRIYISLEQDPTLPKNARLSSSSINKVFLIRFITKNFLELKMATISLTSLKKTQKRALFNMVLFMTSIISGSWENHILPTTICKSLSTLGHIASRYWTKTFLLKNAPKIDSHKMAVKLEQGLRVILG